jgi:hypothetical protein
MHNINIIVVIIFTLFEYDSYLDLGELGSDCFFSFINNNFYKKIICKIIL